MLKFKGLVVVLTLSASLAHAEIQRAVVSGTVGDGNGSPLPGVVLVLTGGGERLTDTSDGSGRYTFTVATAGSYELTATQSSRLTFSASVELQPGAPVELDIEMPIVFSVVVTASRRPQSLVEAPVSISVLDDTYIDNAPADNLADLLRGVPGLSVAQIGARDININSRSASGVLSNSMLVMVDGRSIYENYFGAVLWDLMTVDMNEISQVEVVRSPGSAVWGPNAFNGVVNLRTKSPRDMQGGQAYFNVGEVGTIGSGFRWADAHDTFSYKLSGSYYQQDPWARDTTLPDGSPLPAGFNFENEGTHQPKLDVRVDFDADPERVWTIRGGVAGANGLIMSGLGPSRFLSGSYSNHLEVRRETPTLDLRAYWNRLDAPFNIVLFDSEQRTTADTYVAEGTAQRLRGAHSWTYGGMFRLNRFDLTIAPAQDTRVDVGGFVQDSIALDDQWDLSLGARIDKFQSNEATVAPRTGLTFTPVPGHTFRFAYNRAYRAPSLTENYVDLDLPLVLPLDPPFVVFQESRGSTVLDMERNDAFEVGYSGVVLPSVVLHATLYRQYIKDKIRAFPVAFFGPDNPPPGWPLPPEFAPALPERLTFLNVGDVREQGLELSTSIDWRRLGFLVSYDFRTEPVLRDEDPDFPLQLNTPPRHSFGVVSTFTADTWTGTLQATYTDEAFWSDVLNEPFWGNTDDYVMVNAQLRVHRPRWPVQVVVSGTNLLDQEVKQHIFGDIIRRKLKVGLEWRWQ